MWSIHVYRYYVQLPTEKAHEFHDEDHRNVDKKPEFRLDVIGGDVVNNSDFIESDVRLHPKVVHKIRGLVAGGETRVYAVRKQLRWAVFLMRVLAAIINLKSINIRMRGWGEVSFQQRASILASVIQRHCI